MSNAITGSDGRTYMNALKRPHVAVSLALLTFLTLNFPRALFAQVNLFDEGISLASGSFVYGGLVPFRDYYNPYGPGNAYILSAMRWFGFDSILSYRLLGLILGSFVAAVGTYAVARRGRYAAAAVLAIMVAAFPPAFSYVVAVLLIMVAVVIGEDASLPISANRLTMAGSAVAFAVWFRWELGVVLIWWLLLVLRHSEDRRKVARSAAVLGPLVIAVTPYVAIALAGGLSHLVVAIRYAILDYPTFRGLPFPWSAPIDFVQSIGSGRSGPPFVLSISFFLVGAGIAALALGPLFDRRWPWLRPFDADGTLVGKFVVGTALILVLFARTRPDAAHATQIIALGWLALLWNRMRFTRTAVVAAVIVTLLSLAFVDPLPLSGWPGAIERLAENETSSRLSALGYQFGDERYLGELLAARDHLLISDPQTSEYLFVANRSNTVTHTNAVFVYWLFDARPGHWITTFDPGFADQLVHQTGMVESLCRTGAVVVLMRTPTPDNPPVPPVSVVLDDFLAASYRVEFSNDRYDLLVPIDGDCAFGR